MTTPYRVLVADPPWRMNDDLPGDGRGAASHYATMSTADLCALPVRLVADADSVLALWCPASLLSDGLAVMAAWGYRQTQIVDWIKTPAPDTLLRKLRPLAAGVFRGGGDPLALLDAGLNMGMGRLFRATKEHALIGVRGSVYGLRLDAGLRDVVFAPRLAHSAKPEAFQDALERLMPGPYLELFARRDRAGWTCCGLECPSTRGEDIRDSLRRLECCRQREIA